MRRSGQWPPLSWIRSFQLDRDRRNEPRAILLDTCIPRQNRASALDRIEAVAEIECGMHVLLDEQDDRAGAFELSDDRENLLGNHRRQALARLIDEQCFR